MDWYTIDSIRAAWPDFDAVDDDTLSDILESARLAVIAYAPALPVPTPPDPVVVPANYRQGQLLQARNIWNSAFASPTGDIDGTGFGLTTFPLDWSVQQLLRPKRAVPVIA